MHAMLESGKLIITDAYEQRNIIKLMPERVWDPMTRSWILPVNQETLDLVRSVPGCTVDALVTDLLNKSKICAAIGDVSAELSVQHTPIRPMALKTGVVPYNHQVMTFNIILKHFLSGGCGYAALLDMGTGKTITSIAIIGALFKAGKVRRVLVVAPNSVVPVWAEEYQKFAGYPFNVVVLSGDTKMRRHQMRSSALANGVQVFVVNYESLWRVADYTKGEKRNDALQRCRKEIATWNLDMVVADEMHKIKEPTTNQSRVLHALGDQVRYKLGLTGTPIMNKPLDVFSEYRFIDPNVFGVNFYSFKNHYVIYGGYLNKQVMRYINQEEFAQRMHSIAVRIRKEDCLDLPEQTFENRYCSLEPEAARLYARIRTKKFAELESIAQSKGTVTADNILTGLLRLQQVCSGFLGTDLEDGQAYKDRRIEQVSSAKLDALEDILEDVCIESGKKIVIFTRFTPELAAIKKLCAKLNLQEVAIEGSVPQATRAEYVERFQKDPNCMVFIGQLQTVNFGITLTAADTAVFYSLDFSYANYAQALARIHRIGQKNNCHYIHLIVPNSVDQHILETLEAKGDISKRLVDNWKSIFRE